MTLYPQAFGLPHATAAVKLAFLSVAVWWAVFSLPLLLRVPEPPQPDRRRGRAMMRAGLLQLRQTLADMRRLRMVGLFLLAYWLYIDGVDTIVRMAVDYGLALGFSTHDLLLALLLTQFIGFPAALGFGKLGEYLGARHGILLGIGAYVLITIWGYSISQPWELYALAAAIGLVQGGIQSLSRSFYARLIPAEQSGEFFGLYNMLGKCAAVIGPVLMGWVSLMTGSPRTSILSLLVLFIGGALLLTMVDERRAGTCLRPWTRGTDTAPPMAEEYVWTPIFITSKPLHGINVLPDAPLRGGVPHDSAQSTSPYAHLSRATLTRHYASYHCLL